MTGTLAKRLISSCKRRIRSFVCFNRHIFFSGPVPAWTGEEDVSIVEHKTFLPSLMTSLESHGRESPGMRQKAISRFSHGQRLYECFIDEVLVATFWLHPNGRRFVDEAGYALKLPAGCTFLRDIFVAPEFRGRNIFSKVLSDAVRRFQPEIDRFWSDTTSDNLSSMRAHQKAGLEVVATFWVLHIARRIMIRSSAPKTIGKWTGFKFPQRLLITGSKYRDYVSKNLS